MENSINLSLRIRQLQLSIMGARNHYYQGFNLSTELFQAHVAIAQRASCNCDLSLLKRVSLTSIDGCKGLIGQWLLVRLAADCRTMAGALVGVAGAGAGRYGDAASAGQDLVAARPALIRAADTDRWNVHPVGTT